MTRQSRLEQRRLRLEDQQRRLDELVHAESLMMVFFHEHSNSVHRTGFHAYAVRLCETNFGIHHVRGEFVIGRRAAIGIHSFSEVIGEVTTTVSEIRRNHPSAGLSTIAFFGHGIPQRLQLDDSLSRDTPTAARQFVNGLGAYLSNNVQVIFYACWTGANVSFTGHQTTDGHEVADAQSVQRDDQSFGEGSFADEVRDELQRQGHNNCTVYGHFSRGDSLFNANLRQFSARSTGRGDLEMLWGRNLPQIDVRDLTTSISNQLIEAIEERLNSRISSDNLINPSQHYMPNTSYHLNLERRSGREVGRRIGTWLFGQIPFLPTHLRPIVSSFTTPPNSGSSNYTFHFHDRVLDWFCDRYFSNEERFRNLFPRRHRRH